MRRLCAIVAITAGPWLTVRADQPPLPVPIWLSPFPTAVGQTAEVSSTGIESSYTADAPADAIVAHYKDRASKAGAAVKSFFDGLGTTLRISEGKLACVIRVREDEEEGDSQVQISCAVPSADPPGGVGAPAPSVLPPVTPQPLRPRPAARARRERPKPDDPGMHEVQFEVDGTAPAVEITYTNSSGGRDQMIVNLPYSDSLYLKGGTPVYLSARKRLVTHFVDSFINPYDEVVADGISGWVHVVIRVTGSVLEEASTEAPRGVATVQGRVPK